jgi:hypothetical protein
VNQLEINQTFSLVRFRYCPNLTHVNQLEINQSNLFAGAFPVLYKSHACESAKEINQSNLFAGAFEIVFDDVPLLVANVGRIANCADNLHCFQNIWVHLWHWPVHFSRKPAQIIESKFRIVVTNKKKKKTQNI